MLRNRLINKNMTKQKIKFLGVLIILPAIALTLSGCGKSVSQIVSEKATESLIETQTGGAVNVDIDKNNVRMNINGANLESGSNLKLPDNFPKDVYLIDGNIIASFSDETDNQFSISIESNKPMDELYELYQNKLKGDGWKITGTMNFEDSFSIFSEKDGRVTSVSINKDDNKVTVTIVVY